MAWIRRVRTASGATAVQVAESVAGQRRIVAHVGSAHTEVELGLLLEAAARLLDDPGQGSFDARPLRDHDVDLFVVRLAQHRRIRRRCPRRLGLQSRHEVIT